VLGGLALFTLAGTGGLTVLALRGVAPRRVMAIGLVSLVFGTVITLFASAMGSLPWFFVGTAVAGSGFGAAFHGALRFVLPTAEEHERSGVLSTVFVVCYLAFGLPAVAAGLRVTHGAGLLTTSREYGLAVIALAALALLGLARPLRGPEASKTTNW
jgi:hypothetical protein